jgi:subtilase family serine protease
MNRSWKGVLGVILVLLLLVGGASAVSCPVGCQCMLESQAKSLGYATCGDKPILCGEEPTKTGQVLPKYCYTVPVTSTPVTIIKCPVGSVCLASTETKGYTRDLQETRPCGYDAYQNLMYCYVPLTTVTPISTGTPDLIINDVYTDATGAFREVRYIIQNVGDGPSGASTTALYIDGVKIGEDEAAGLGPGEFRAERFSHSGVCSGGSDVLGGKADIYDAVAESNEDNNAREREYLCPAESGQPDLDLADIWHEGEENFTFTIREYTATEGIHFLMKSAGSVGTSPSEARLYIDGIWVSTVAIPSIAEGGGYEGSFGYLGICSGTTDSIRVVLDPSNSVIELQETNNERTEILNCTVAPASSAKPDLIIRRMYYIPHSDYLREIRYEIKNQGTGWAPFTETGLYIDGVLDVQSGVDRLAPGESRELRFWKNYSMRTCTGSSDELRIVADHDEAVAETHEANNDYTQTWNCTEIPGSLTPKPDLVIHAVWYECELPCRELILKYTLLNQGSVPAPASDTTLYINYHEWGTSHAGPLEPGAATTLSFRDSWVPPSRENHIQISADFHNDVDEISPPPGGELNNIREENWTFGGSCEDLVSSETEEGIDCGGLFCPACVECSWCPAGVSPLRLRGQPEDKIDVVFVPDTSYGGNVTLFTEDIRRAVTHGYYASDAIFANRDKLNLYYIFSGEATVTGYDATPRATFSYSTGCDGFQDQTVGADSIAVLHRNAFRDWAGTRCERRIFLSEPESNRTFVHESGHSLFGLKDEYCCDSSYRQNDPNPNIYATRSACRDDATASGWDPNDCVEFCTSGSGNCGDGYWKVDPDPCIMRCSQSCNGGCCSTCTGAGQMCQFEPACLRRVNGVFSRYV